MSGRAKTNSDKRDTLARYMDDDQQSRDYEASEQPVNAMMDNDNNDEMMQKKRRCRNYTICGIITVVIAVVAAVLIYYFTTRPKDIPVVTAPLDARSPPTLVKYGSVQGFASGSVRIDATTNLNSNTRSLASSTDVRRYWLTVSNDTQYPNNGGTNNITLALTKSNDVTSLDTSMLLLIANIKSQTFPLALPEDFDPTLWKGVVFVDGDISSTSLSSNAQIVGSVVWSFDSTTTSTSNGGGGTNSPAAAPTSSSSSLQLQADLCCSFTGRISLQYRMDIVNGVPTSIPYFLFEDITVTPEPAPYLYLSHSPNGSPINAAGQDVLLLIQGTDSTGSFSKAGTFTQDFPSSLTLDALPSFAGGSFIVWCTDYSVWLASGALVIS